MKKSDCIEFANDNPLCFLATTDGDQPRVRALQFWFADDTGFYFQTGSIKEMVSQIEKNPKVEVAFYKPGEGAGTMMRVCGKADLLEDKEIRERVMKDRPFLSEFGLTADSPALVVFRISSGKAHFWTWETNLSPKEYIEF